MASSQATANDRPEYRYDSQLAEGQIRVLRFKSPLSENEPLSLEVATTALPVEGVVPEVAMHRYIALSYVWGEAKDMRSILVDGCVFWVTPNLALALRHLKNRIDLPVWIDAICINQGDDEEKGRQVKRMQDVYRHAERTMIWLGEGSEQEEQMITKLDIVGERAKAAGILELTRNDMAAWPVFGGTESADARRKLEIKAGLEAIISDMQSQRLSFSTSDLALFVDLTYRPWFYRVWVVQELCSSEKPEFVVGSTTINCEAFMAGFQIVNLWIVGELMPLIHRSLLLYLPIFIVSCAWRNGRPFLRFLFNGMMGGRATPSGRAASTLGTRKTSQNSIDLKGLLARAFSPINGGTLEASFPKDRVYGLLGLASDRESLGIKLHYEAEKTYQEVYTDVARKLLQHGHIDILSICRSSLPDPKRDSALPSWTPDWLKPLRAAWGQFSEDRLFDASRNHPLCPVNTSHAWCSETVHLKAFLVGVIDLPPQVAANSESTPMARHLKTIEEVAKLLASATSKYTDMQRSEGRWRIPVADREFNDVGQIIRATKRSSWEHTWIRWAGQSPWLALLLPTTLGYHDRMAELEDGIPCMTDTQYVGICPDVAKTGDEVWLPLGAHVPYVFRRVENGRHELVGEAFIYGIMDGELFESNPRSEVLIVQ